MKHKEARQEGVPCANLECEFFTLKGEQNCGAEKGNGPAVETCEDYEPGE